MEIENLKALVYNIPLNPYQKQLARKEFETMQKAALNIADVNNHLPCICPVCRGNGLVPNGFYEQTSGDWVSTDATPDKCQSCDGTGVIYT